MSVAAGVAAGVVVVVKSNPLSDRRVFLGEGDGDSSTIDRCIDLRYQHIITQVQVIEKRSRT